MLVASSVTSLDALSTIVPAAVTCALSALTVPLFRTAAP